MKRERKPKNAPVMTGEKTCIRCGCSKPVLEFHKHAMMADGRLNKCRTCVKECVAEWRLKNPGCRAVEHANNRKRKGFSTREEYFAKQSANKIGRKAVSLKYFYKRRALQDGQVSWDAELDDFVMEEAALLAQKREAELGGRWEIDHIVPLMHKKACGLHNAYNLQVVPKQFNRNKGNRSMSVFLGA